MYHYKIIEQMTIDGDKYYQIVYTDPNDKIAYEYVALWCVENKKFLFGTQRVKSKAPDVDRTTSLEYAKMVLYNFKLYNKRLNHCETVYEE